MNIKTFQKQWNALGQDDPMWAVLTDPEKKGNRWDPDDFFASGVTQIDQVWQRLSSLGITVNPGSAVDFGCGLGRLTQALCRRFETCVGIDISESMVKSAQEYNRYPDKCTYRVNGEPDLRQLADGSSDFVLSLIALQHTATRFQLQYIREFIRILKPGGIAYFQVIEPTFLRGLIPDAFTERYRQWKHQGKPFISMYGAPRSRVKQIAAQENATVVDCHVQPYGEFEGRWRDYTWCLRKA